MIRPRLVLHRDGQKHPKPTVRTRQWFNVTNYVSQRTSTTLNRSIFQCNGRRTDTVAQLKLQIEHQQHPFSVTSVTLLSHIARDSLYWDYGSSSVMVKIELRSIAPSP